MDSNHVSAKIESVPSPIEITHHEVPLPNLPTTLDGIRLVHLTDFHVGCGDSAASSREAAALVNSLSPDLILLTGDYVNRRVSEIEPSAEILSSLRAHRGIFASLGNHDYYADSGAMAAALRRIGFRVLDNESVEISPGLWIAAIDDLHMGHGDVNLALKDIPKRAATVLLSHNPNALNIAPRDWPLIILSGHTHGGQIVVPFPSPHLICRLHLGTDYVNGWYQRGEPRMYVSRGIGVTGTPPLNRRFRCPPEIAVFVLRAA